MDVFKSSTHGADFAGLVENWRNDLLAVFLVSLIALLLCLGIAMAGNIGGLLVSPINGIAAGVIVVLVNAAVFSNIISLKSLLTNFRNTKNVYFDLNAAKLLVNTLMKFIHHRTAEHNQAGCHCEFGGLYTQHAYSNHHPAARRKRS